LAVKRLTVQWLAIGLKSEIKMQGNSFLCFKEPLVENRGAL